MAKGIKRIIVKVQEKVRREISDNAKGGHFAAGLASEGYSGGYLDALSDVLLSLNGVKPQRRHYWED